MKAACVMKRCLQQGRQVSRSKAHQSTGLVAECDGERAATIADYNEAEDAISRVHDLAETAVRAVWCVGVLPNIAQEHTAAG